MSIKSIDYQLAAKLRQGISGVRVMIACLCVPVTLHADAYSSVRYTKGHLQVCARLESLPTGIRLTTKDCVSVYKALHGRYKRR